MIDRILLLDTHVWVWAQDGLPQLGAGVAAALEDAARRGALRVSVISVWEIGMLVAKNRLRLSLAVDDWINRGLNQRGLQMSTLTAAVAIDSTRLPDSPAKDPADRILIATARAVGATLITSDRRILDYAKAGHLRAMDAAA
jgi:PIN domain nuclease of toxin-antitoxin system